MPAPVDLDAEVLANTHLSPDCHVLALDAPAIAAVARPGQFVMLRATAGTDPLLRRPFSIFDIVRRDDGSPRGIAVLSKRVGVVTSLLYDARPGDRIGCLGPLGQPFCIAAPPAHIWMVAGGVGLAPFGRLADATRHMGAARLLFYGGRRAADLILLDWFAKRGVHLELATEDGSLGSPGPVSVPLERALQTARPDEPLVMYACGPEPMLRAVGDLGARYGRPAQLSMERIMGCGMGGCYSCVVRVKNETGREHYVRSCLAGPVFDSRDLVWE
jgi:dihydroorotate dehydrogenase electron transfer subunit